MIPRMEVESAEVILAKHTIALTNESVNAMTQHALTRLWVTISDRRIFCHRVSTGSGGISVCRERQYSDAVKVSLVFRGR